MTNDGQGAAAPRLNETLKAALEQRFGERFSVSHGVREHHGRDESIYPLTLPEGVVFAESTEDVVDLVKLCRAHHCPIVPWGRVRPSRASCWRSGAASRWTCRG